MTQPRYEQASTTPEHAEKLPPTSEATLKLASQFQLLTAGRILPTYEPRASGQLGAAISSGSQARVYDDQLHQNRVIKVGRRLPMATEAHSTSAIRSRAVPMWSLAGRLATAAPRFDGRPPDMTNRTEARLAASCAAEELAQAHRLGIVLNDIQPSAVALNTQGEAQYIDFNLSLMLPSVDIEAVRAVLQRARGDWDIQKFLNHFTRKELTGMFGPVRTYIGIVEAFEQDYQTLMSRPVISPQHIKLLLERHLPEIQTSIVFTRAAGPNLKELANKLSMVSWQRLATPPLVSRWIERVFSPAEKIKRVKDVELLTNDLAFFRRLLTVFVENLKYTQQHVQKSADQQIEEYADLIARVFRTDPKLENYHGVPAPYFTWHSRNEDAVQGLTRTLATMGSQARPRPRDGVAEYTNVAKLVEALMQNLLGQFWQSVTLDWQTWYDEIALYAAPKRSDGSYELLVSRFHELIGRLRERAQAQEFDTLAMLERQLVELARQLCS